MLSSPPSISANDDFGMLQRGIRVVEWKNIHDNILDEYLDFHKLYMGSAAAL